MSDLLRADAPGRVNLIGEHTDYHDGFVLPCAVPQRTTVTLRKRADRRMRVTSEQVPGETLEYEIGHESVEHRWGDYVQGVTWALGRHHARLGGCEIAIASEVPLGSGLSSSAALEIALLRALRTAFDLRLSDVELARIAQRAEVEFVGAPVGIMDQMASSLAGERDALFLDTRSLEFSRIPLPDDLDLIVIDSGIAHQHAGGDYVTRRRESEEAARRLGVDKLRDAGRDALERLSALPPLLARRARHVITENARVLEARDALLAGDLPRLGALFAASHASMRDDYEISIPAIDTLVAIVSADARVFGARMTGGGFGGAIVAAAQRGTGLDAARRAVDRYQRETGARGSILVPVAS
jgi:galactokinase